MIEIFGTNHIKVRRVPDISVGKLIRFFSSIKSNILINVFQVKVRVVEILIIRLCARIRRIEVTTSTGFIDVN